MLNDAGDIEGRAGEARARSLLAEGKYWEADRVIAEVVRALETSGDEAMLADALALQGVARARLGSPESSVEALRRALKTAEDSGALTSAGLAALTLIEEHGAERLSDDELFDLYARADAFLGDTQDEGDIARLRECARVVLERAAGSRVRDDDFTLQSAIQELEAKFIERALAEAGGSVTRAARLLGMRYQSLTNLLNTKHRSLLKKRTPPRKRMQSIIGKQE